MAPADRPCRAGSDTAHALLDVCQAALHLRAREVLVAIVDRFELAAIDGDARSRQQADLWAKRDELRTYLADFSGLESASNSLQPGRLNTSA